MTLRKSVARRLRILADRIHPDSSIAVMTSYSFTFEQGIGLVFRTDQRGCPLYYPRDQYDRAHEEAGYGSYNYYIQHHRQELH